MYYLGEGPRSFQARVTPLWGCWPLRPHLGQRSNHPDQLLCPRGNTEQRPGNKHPRKPKYRIKTGRSLTPSINWFLKYLTLTGIFIIWLFIFPGTVIGNVPSHFHFQAFKALCPSTLACDQQTHDHIFVLCELYLNIALLRRTPP